jgi:hypothetical protein
MPEYRVEHASGYTSGSIGYLDHAHLRVGASVEKILNKGAEDGFVLDRLEPLKGNTSERILVVMRKDDDA